MANFINFNPNNRGDYSYTSGGYTYGVAGSFNQNAFLNKVYFYSAVASTYSNVRAVVYSGGVKLYEGPQTTFTTTAGSRQELPVESFPVVSGTAYRIGFYYPGGAAIAYMNLASGNSGAYTLASGSAVASTPAGITFTTSAAGMYADSGATAPVTNVPAYNTIAGFSLEFGPPTAPTGVSSNTPVIIGNPLTVNWTHNDPDSDQQVKYQIRYRRKDV